MKFLPLFIFIFLLYSKNSYAYLDPGTTTLIIQSIIAGVAGFFVALKIYWVKIKTILNKILKIKKGKSN